jgi:hypothetical protein
MKRHRLVLAHHSVDEWVAIRAEQARALGCSDAFVKRLVAELLKRSEVPVDKSTSAL